LSTLGIALKEGIGKLNKMLDESYGDPKKDDADEDDDDDDNFDNSDIPPSFDYNFGLDNNSDYNSDNNFVNSDNNYGTFANNVDGDGNKEFQDSDNKIPRTTDNGDIITNSEWASDPDRIKYYASSVLPHKTRPLKVHELTSAQPVGPLEQKVDFFPEYSKILNIKGDDPRFKLKFKIDSI
jgi:hypothetical protein